MAEPRGTELVERYRANYQIPPDSRITEKMILEHWELEKSLAAEMLQSSPEDRWIVFERCYSRLYNELPWLNEQVGTGRERVAPEIRYADWRSVIGDGVDTVFEVGSGKGDLILHLSECGFKCRATEITRERGQKWAVEHPNLSWNVTDGIHLDEFEDPESFDCVISDQVIEHLHPDDALDHFRGVFAILSPGGRYLVRTPHRCVGPADVSAVFNCDRPLGMHLKEYSYREVACLARQAGFTWVGAPFRLPKKVQRLFGAAKKAARVSSAYLWHQYLMEYLVELLPSKQLRRRATTLARLLLFQPGLWVVARKGQ